MEKSKQIKSEAVTVFDPNNENHVGLLNAVTKKCFNKEIHKDTIREFCETLDNFFKDKSISIKLIIHKK